MGLEVTNWSFDGKFARFLAVFVSNCFTATHRNQETETTLLVKKEPFDFSQSGVFYKIFSRSNVPQSAAFRFTKCRFSHVKVPFSRWINGTFSPQKCHFQKNTSFFPFSKCYYVHKRSVKIFPYLDLTKFSEMLIVSERSVESVFRWISV